MLQGRVRSWQVMALVLILAALNADAASGSSFTLAVYGAEAAPTQVTGALQEELTDLLADVGIRVHWRPAEPAAKLLVEGPLLAVVRLHGVCAARPGWDVRIPRRSYARVHGQRGEILPFVDVDCDKISSVLSPHLKGEPAGRVNTCFGKALARVLAHELYHVISQRATHTASGITQEALSVQELLGTNLRFPDEALRVMRERISARAEIAYAGF